MLKCTVQGCTDTCWVQCYKRISPQRAEAIKNLGIVHAQDNVCLRCGKQYIKARRNGENIYICSCRVD